MEIDMLKERVRAFVRPVMLGAFIAGSFYFITHGLSGEWIDKWHMITFGGSGLWLLERPIIKIATRKP